MLHKRRCRLTFTGPHSTGRVNIHEYKAQLVQLKQAQRIANMGYEYLPNTVPSPHGVSNTNSTTGAIVLRHLQKHAMLLHTTAQHG